MIIGDRAESGKLERMKHTPAGHSREIDLQFVANCWLERGMHAEINPHASSPEQRKLRVWTEQNIILVSS
jgi:hypothetical protein